MFHVSSLKSLKSLKGFGFEEFEEFKCFAFKVQLPAAFRGLICLKSLKCLASLSSLRSVEEFLVSGFWFLSMFDIQYSIFKGSRVQLPAPSLVHFSVSLCVLRASVVKKNQGSSCAELAALG